MTDATLHPQSLLGTVLAAVIPAPPASREAPGQAGPMPRPSAPIVLDEAILGRARSGDRAARAMLVGQLQDVWYRFCLGMLGQPDAARDAAQETALRFLRGLAGFEGRSTLKTWSLSIAINTCRERRRADHRLRPGLSTLDRPDPAPGPAQRAGDAELRDRLLTCLGMLSDRQREVVTLRFFEQLSVAETAQAMGCAQGTVKATLSQAIRALRKLLEVRDA